MPYYVYLLQSEIDGSYYKGFSENSTIRLARHNNGESQYTSRKMPWKLLHVEEVPDKRTAIIREKNLKKASVDRLIHLIESSKNIVSRLISRSVIIGPQKSLYKGHLFSEKLCRLG